MNDEGQILRSDLTILEEMVIEVEPFLMNDAIRWPMTKRDRPKRSIRKLIRIKARASSGM